MANRYGSDIGNNERDTRFLDSEYSLGNGVSMEREFERGFKSSYPDRMTAGYEYGRKPSHYGKGPLGYSRSPDRIREDLCERLAHHPDLDASNIDVIVKGADVFLEGEVEGRDGKWMAEDVAEGTLGVDRVINHLKVIPESNSRGGYQLSAKAAREARNTDQS